MNTECENRCYDYVNHTHERVRDAFRQNALTLFLSSTQEAGRNRSPQNFTSTSAVLALGPQCFCERH